MSGVRRNEMAVEPDQDEISVDVEPHLFSFQGRISRVMFWRRIGLGFLIFGVIEFALQAIADAVLVSLIWSFLGIIIVGEAFYFAAQSVKRLHDLNRSGWIVLWCLTVVFIPVALVWLGSTPGTEGPNRFGFPPPDAEGS